MKLKATFIIFTLIYFHNFLLSTSSNSPIYKTSNFFYSQFAQIVSSTSTNFNITLAVARLNVMKTQTVIAEFDKPAHLQAVADNIQFFIGATSSGVTATWVYFYVNIFDGNTYNIGVYFMLFSTQTTNYVDIVTFNYGSSSPAMNNQSDSTSRIYYIPTIFPGNTIFPSFAGGFQVIPFFVAIDFRFSAAMQTNPPTILAQYRIVANVANSTAIDSQVVADPYCAINAIRVALFIHCYTCVSNSRLAGIDVQFNRAYYNLNGAGTFLLTTGPGFSGMGLPFQNKCFFGFHILQHYWNANYHFNVVLNANNQVTGIKQLTGVSASNSIGGGIYCIGMDKYCLLPNQYYDSTSDNCYTSNTCPLPIPAGWTYVNTCPRCNQIICSKCNSLDRRQCITCKTGSFSTLNVATNQCECNTNYDPLYMDISNTSGLWFGQNSSLYSCTLSCQVQVPNCNKYRCSNTSYCTQCAYGFYVQINSGTNQTCAMCSMSNCLSCSTISWCNQCDDLYYVDGVMVNVNNCLPCSALTSCINCTDSLTCTQCFSGFYADSVTGVCYLCSILSNCANCTDAVTCVDCYIDYYVNHTTFQCEPCNNLPGCFNCTDQFICTDCDDLYFLNTTTSWCQPCTDLVFCFNCTDENTCVQCQIGYVTKTVGSTVICVVCSYYVPYCIQCTRVGAIVNCVNCLDEYYSDGSSICHPCLPNCHLCFDPTFCLQCIYGYSFTNSSCAPCNIISNCQTCITLMTVPQSLRCSTCVLGYYRKLNATTGIYQCLKCSLVMSNCQNCSDQNTCVMCNYPFQSGITSKCDTCVIGFTYFQNICIKQPGCQYTVIINSNVVCIACAVSLGFTYDSIKKVCFCNKGSKLIKFQGEPQKCINICGDGIVVYPQQCDDSNIRDYDGCSSNCIPENDYSCDSNSPTKCILNKDFIKFELNYLQKLEGQNKAVFTFTLTPSFKGLQNIDWSPILSVNFGDVKTDPLSFKYSYSASTSKLKFQFAYLSTLQNKYLQALLRFPSDLIISNPSFHSLSFKVEGINQPLIYEDEELLKAYQVCSYISLIIMILMLIQFFAGSYLNKMIGLQTIQIVQFIYFIRILLKRQQTTIINSLNDLKYTAFGGYAISESNFPDLSVFFTEKLQMVNKRFISIDLQKYTLLNLNFSLIPLVIVLVVYSVSLIRKYLIRSQYIETRILSTKDRYTLQKRTSQRVYDNFVFPYTLMFSFVLELNMLFFLQSQSQIPQLITSDQSRITRLLQQEVNSIDALNNYNNIQYSSLNLVNQEFISTDSYRILAQASIDSIKNKQVQYFPSISYLIQMILLFLNFSIYCYEIFQSYSEYRRYNMSARQKNNMPFSLIEKLQHDQNDLYLKKNFHPLYCLVYLCYYQLITTLLIIEINLANVFTYGLQIMTGLTLFYFIIISVWKPYKQQTNSHNNFLKLNHFSTLLFLVICLIFQRAGHLSTKIYILLISFIMFLLVLVMIGGYVRIFIQYRFNLMVDDNLIQKTSSNKQFKTKSSIQNALYNKYLFNNQVKQFYLNNKNQIYHQVGTINKNKTNPLSSFDNDFPFIQDQIQMSVQQKQNIIKLMRRQIDDEIRKQNNQQMIRLKQKLVQNSKLNKNKKWDSFKVIGDIQPINDQMDECVMINMEKESNNKKNTDLNQFQQRIFQKQSSKVNLYQVLQNVNRKNMKLKAQNNNKDLKGINVNTRKNEIKKKQVKETNYKKRINQQKILNQ